MSTENMDSKSLLSDSDPAPVSLVKMTVQLWKYVDPLRRRQLTIVLLLTILASVCEVASIGLVLPFLGALATPDKLFHSTYARPLIDYFSLTESGQMLLPLTAIFCIASIATGVIRIILLRTSLNLSFSLGADLSNDVYKRTLYQPYSVHIARNSSEIITGISTKTAEVIYYVLMPGLSLLSSLAIALAIASALCIFIPLAALIGFGLLGIAYAFLVKTLRRTLKTNSQQIAVEQINTIKYLQEGLGGIRDILIDGTQETFAATFRKSDAILRKAQGSNQFIAQSPRFVIESSGMVLIAAIAYYLSQSATSSSGAISILAVLALGLQRLLPALQQAYHSWSTIRGAQESLKGVLELLHQPLPQQTTSRPNAIPFEQEIHLSNISFRYSAKGKWILRGLNLTISKGARIGFVGTTGSGKSTLLDIVMGLLTPNEGEMSVDGRTLDAHNLDAWRLHVAHVPQSIFLSDSSVIENIAFGVPLEDIDRDAAKVAAHQAQIGETIEAWPAGYDTMVGERGVQLSGGQRQRLGIARALYKKADVIVFDEATSALDTATEDAVMTSIEALSGRVTVLLIAHRLSTLKNCSQVFSLSRSGVDDITRLQIVPRY